MIAQEQLPMVAMDSMNDTHLEEVLLINKLDTAAKAGDVKVTSELLNELLEHTVIHFFGEEDMMQETLFPAFAMHKGEHDRHLQEFQSLIQYFQEKQDTKAITTYIEGSLTPWLINHINTMDTMTAMFLKQGMPTACSATKGCTTGEC